MSSRLPWAGRLSRGAEAAVANPFVAYGAVLVVQIHVIWKVWQYNDLNPGDTANYFVDAAGWSQGLHEDLAFSPLYDAFFGTILYAVRDVYAAAMIHRVAIVLMATLLVLALMRSLLGPALGLLAALWWAVIPANFNALYEVHLFGAVMFLLAAVVVARAAGRTGRGIALAVLLGAAILVRNELLAATVILAGVLAVYEWRARRSSKPALGAYARSYGIPLAVVVLLAGGAYWKSTLQGDYLKRELQLKSELALCTAYAANLQQRHPAAFTGNPFTECQALMQQVFGRPLPSLVQAAAADPRAMLAFAAWNAREVPSAVALGLFGAMPTGFNPGYTPVKAHSGYALVLSILVLLVIAAGAAALLRDREFWRRDWLPPRRWTLVVLGSIVLGDTLVVVFNVRPWTEYTFALSVGALAIVGVSVSALFRRVGASRLLAPIAAGVAIALAVGVPTFYRPGPRPLHDAVDRLQEVRPALDVPGSILLASNSAQQMCFYLAASSNRWCGGQAWVDLRAQVTPTEPVDAVLARAGVDVIYADAAMLGDPVAAPLFQSPGRYGWRQVAGGTGSDGTWRVLVPVHPS